MQLLDWLVIVLVALVAFGLVVCVAERQWRVLVFALVMLAGTTWLMIYGAGHT